MEAASEAVDEATVPRLNRAGGFLADLVWVAMVSRALELVEGFGGCECRMIRRWKERECGERMDWMTLEI